MNYIETMTNFTKYYKYGFTFKITFILVSKIKDEFNHIINEVIERKIKSYINISLGSKIFNSDDNKSIMEIITEVLIESINVLEELENNKESKSMIDFIINHVKALNLDEYNLEYNNNHDEDRFALIISKSFDEGFNLAEKIFIS